MNPEIKKKWTDALRSGKYEQGYNRLKNIILVSEGKDLVTHCCLGVLCELAVEEKICYENDRYFGSKEHVLSWDALPKAVSFWAELDDSDPVVEDRHLSIWNDRYQKSFNEIADLIDEHL